MTDLQMYEYKQLTLRLEKVRSSMGKSAIMHPESQFIWKTDPNVLNKWLAGRINGLRRAGKL